MEAIWSHLKELDPLVGLVGLLVSLAGFGVAIFQLVKTRRAASAAEAAARNAESSIHSLLAVVSLQEICSRSSDLLHLLRARNLHAAATAAFEVRKAVAQFSSTEKAGQLQDPDGWGNAATKIASIHDRLESAASVNRIDSDERAAMIHEVAAEHERFSALAARAAAGRRFYADPE